MTGVTATSGEDQGQETGTEGEITKASEATTTETVEVLNKTKTKTIVTITKGMLRIIKQKITGIKIDKIDQVIDLQLVLSLKDTLEVITLFFHTKVSTFKNNSIEKRSHAQNKTTLTQFTARCKISKQ